METATVPAPFFTAKDAINGIPSDLFYFRSPADAEAFRTARGGWILETSPGTIWRVTVPA